MASPEAYARVSMAMGTNQFLQAGRLRRRV